MGVGTWLAAAAAGILALVGIGYVAERSNAGQGFSSLGQGIGSGLSGVGAGIGTGIQDVLNPFENLSYLIQKWAGPAGADVGNAFAGVSSAVGGAENSVSGGVSSIENFFGHVFGGGGSTSGSTSGSTGHVDSGPSGPTGGKSTSSDYSTVTQAPVLGKAGYSGSGVIYHG